MRNQEKKVAFTIIVIFTSFLLLAFGLIFVTEKEISSNKVSDFREVDGSHLVQANLAPKLNRLYVVGRYLSKRKLAGINSIDLVVSNSDGELINKSLKRDSGKSDGMVDNKYLSKSLFYSFKISKQDVYTITINNYDAYGGIDLVNFSLHSNSSMVLKNTIILIGFLLMCVGLLSALYLSTSYGIRKLLELFLRDRSI